MTDTGKCPAFGYDCEYVAKVDAQEAEIERLERSRSAWEDEARRYAGNSEYWQTETERLRAVLKMADDFLRNAPLASGYCCCGDAIEAHGMWSGHSPVDEVAYHASGISEQIRAALGETE